MDNEISDTDFEDTEFVADWSLSEIRCWLKPLRYWSLPLKKKKKTLNFVNQKLKYFKIPRSRLHMDSREAAEEIIYQVDDELIDKEAMESIADRTVAAEDWQNYVQK